MHGALALCAVYLLLTLPSIVFEAAVWLPLAAPAAAVGMALLLRAARPHIHAGLQGFLLAVPLDGMALLGQDGIRSDSASVARQWLRRLAMVAPAMFLLAIPWAAEPRRWPLWLLVGLGLCAPALLVAYARAWSAPFLLVLVSSGLAGRAAAVRAQLPPGHWETHWRSVPCSGQLALAGDGSAWCVDARGDVVYRYALRSGCMMQAFDVTNPWAVIAAAGDTAWVRQQPVNGLVQLQGGAARKREFGRPVVGALTDPDHQLWFLDGLLRVHVFDGDAVRRISTADGLLGHQARVVRVLPDGSIWIGFEHGVSRLAPGSPTWESFGREHGLRGAVMDIAAGPDGAVWLLQADSYRTNLWWVSALRPDGSWLHVDMLQLTGLQPPRTRDAIVVDARGRLWFVAFAAQPRQALVGILDAQATEVETLVSLGAFPRVAADRLFAGPRADAHGLLTDGQGGVLLYVDSRAPLRHWRP